jgi:proteasome lid subunit RPN8/RPN11
MSNPILSKQDQIRLLETGPYPIAVLKSDRIQIQLFPKVSLSINLAKYPKKPTFEFEKHFQKRIGDLEHFIPKLRNWDATNPPEIIRIVEILKQTVESITGALVHISHELLKELFQIAEQTHPNEMFCFLRLRNGGFAEYVLAPKTYRSEKNVVFFSAEVDNDRTLVASCHSHPTQNCTPSEADLNTFRKKAINIILGYPFNISMVGVYDSRGERVQFDTIELDE